MDMYVFLTLAPGIAPAVMIQTERFFFLTPTTPKQMTYAET